MFNLLRRIKQPKYLPLLPYEDRDEQCIAPNSETIDDAFLRLIWCVLWYDDHPKATQMEFANTYNVPFFTLNGWLCGKRKSKDAREAVLNFVRLNKARLRVFSVDICNALIDEELPEQELPIREEWFTRFSKSFSFFNLYSFANAPVVWYDWQFIWCKYKTFEGVPLCDSKAVSSAVMKARLRRNKRDDQLMPVWDVLSFYAHKLPIPVTLLFKGRPEVATRLGKLK